MSPASGVSERNGLPVAGPPGRVDSPPATRRTTSRWRDPRLWLGVLLVAASVVVGARLLAAADDTVAVWRLEHDMAAGLPVTAADLTTTQVHFADSGAAEAYLSATEVPSSDLRLSRPVTAGELLSRSSLQPQTAARPAELPLAVGTDAVPPDLAPGDRVQVWAVPDQAQRAAETVEVLTDVLVVSVSSPTATGAGSDRSVVVALPPETDIEGVLSAMAAHVVVLVRTGP